MTAKRMRKLSTSNRSRVEYPGLLTGSFVAQPDDVSKLQYHTLYYDYCGRLIQDKETNHKGGVESKYLAYNFAGSPVKTEHIHTSGSNTITEYTYNKKRSHD